jgi:O-methyltransferase
MVPPEDRAAELYLELLEHCLAGVLDRQDLIPIDRPASPVKRLLLDLLRRRGLELAMRRWTDADVDGSARSWPATGLTLVGIERLENLRHCVEGVLDAGVPGDLVETGVWRGGASLMMKAILTVRGDETRSVWLADSFRGLPEPDEARYPADAGSTLWKNPRLRVSLDSVRANFSRYGLLDDRVRFVEGWFRDTLPGLRGETFAVVRLDGDMYESTMDALVNLYPALSPGGYLIVDDYGDTRWAAGQAVDDYRVENGISAPLQDVDGTCVFWQKPG